MLWKYRNRVWQGFFGLCHASKGIALCNRHLPCAPNRFFSVHTLTPHFRSAIACYAFAPAPSTMAVADT